MTEKNEAKRDGARLQKNSGRGTKKGDAVWKHFLVDYKEASRSFVVNHSVWGKVCSDALKEGLDYSPLIKIILGDKESRKVRLALLAWDELEEIIEDRDFFKKRTYELEQELSKCESMTIEREWQ